MNWRERTHLQGWRLWALVAVLAYTLIGFLFLPWLARNQAPKLAQENLGVDLAIEKIRFNPYLFKLTVEGLSLEDPAHGRGPVPRGSRVRPGAGLPAAGGGLLAVERLAARLDLRRTHARAALAAAAPRRRRRRQHPAHARPPAAAGGTGRSGAGRRPAPAGAAQHLALRRTARHRRRGPPGALVAGDRPARLLHAGFRHAARARGRLQPGGDRAARRHGELERQLRGGPAGLLRSRRDRQRGAGALLGIRAP